MFSCTTLYYCQIFVHMHYLKHISFTPKHTVETKQIYICTSHDHVKFDGILLLKSFNQLLLSFVQSILLQSPHDSSLLSSVHSHLLLLLFCTHTHAHTHAHTHSKTSRV